jgi:hypothetical protein
MDERYNTMVLDIYFELMGKLTFSTPQIPKSGACSSSILCPLCFSYLYLSIIIHNTYTHIKDKEKVIKFYLNY